MGMRGYFEIGIFHPKKHSNIGTLWRSAYQLGASGIFVIGPRYQRQASDTCKAYRHIPLREYESFETLLEVRPYGCQIVGIEMGGQVLSEFSHPERAIYLLGAEDHGLPPAVLEKCNQRVSLESVRTNSYNVSVSGSIVMYHRQFFV